MRVEKLRGRRPRHCEVAIGVDDSYSAPVIKKCLREAAALFFSDDGPCGKFGMRVCQQHLDHFLSSPEGRP